MQRCASRTGGRPGIAQMTMQVGCQGGEQLLGEHIGMLQPRGTQVKLDTPSPAGVHPAPVAGAGCGRLAHHDQVEIAVQVVEVRIREGVQSRGA